jgi:hypothetical protein
MQHEFISAIFGANIQRLDDSVQLRALRSFSSRGLVHTETSSRRTAVYIKTIELSELKVREFYEIIALFPPADAGVSPIPVTLNNDADACNCEGVKRHRKQRRSCKNRRCVGWNSWPCRLFQFIPRD